jgi:acyl carrier protein
MDRQGARLANCFLAVFPELNDEDISNATSATVQSWDSVAGVTLLAVVEEEFGITVEVDDLSEFNSFQGFLNYLQSSERLGHTSSDEQS